MYDYFLDMILSVRCVFGVRFFFRDVWSTVGTVEIDEMTTLSS